ncbi:DUF3990 domain-containing protein [Aestuariivirga sp.]|uniref:DUF3990 domain-containing protein n=1 Tax=Aestuariivirga sp. TaxID=2650926 RepID=UPI0039E4BDE2
MYHGSVYSHFQQYKLSPGHSIPSFGVDLSRCRPRTDFGRGFYLTTSLEQAEKWANIKSLRSRSADQPLILEFNIDLEVFCKLDYLWFVRASDEFNAFVRRCRRHDTWHKVSRTDDPYDVVLGPLSKFPGHTVYDGCDQFSLHTQRAIGLMPKPMVRSVMSKSIQPVTSPAKLN